MQSIFALFCNDENPFTVPTKKGSVLEANIGEPQLQFKSITISEETNRQENIV